MTSRLQISAKEFLGFMSKVNLKHKERIGIEFIFFFSFNFLFNEMNVSQF